MTGVATSVANTKPLRPWFVSAAMLVLLFSYPLYQLIRFSIGHELYSHLALIPLASLGLVWLKRHTLPPNSTPDPRLAILPFVTATLLIIGYAACVFAKVPLSREDLLAIAMLSFVLLLAGTAAMFIGKQLFCALAFPFGFLAFMAPFPTFVEEAIEARLQRGSAEAAHLLFQSVGTPVFREGYRFQLPGITLEVATQCSGIHSTLALFITSLAAGYWLLRSPWKRALLALAVIPLALLRNGFRVFTIGELCVHVDPTMVNSYIHREGGPIFFLLSLLPFSLLLILLMRSERRFVNFR